MRYPCPVCRYSVFSESPGSYAICPVCGWEDDQIQFGNPYYQGGANKESLNEAKEVWAKSNIVVSVLTADEGGAEYIFSRLANDLNLPSYFGKNFNALDECLAADVTKARIIWNNSEQAKISLGNDFSTFVSVIEDASKKNSEIKLRLQ